MDVTLPEWLEYWLRSNRDLAYLLGFVAISLGFYALYPFTIGLNHATSYRIPFSAVNVGRQIRKPHRLALLTCAVLVFSVLHLVFSMSGLALLAGGTVVGVLVVADHLQIHRENQTPR